MAYVNIKGSVAGKSATLEYQFLVIEGARYIGLPQADIDTLNLKPSMFTKLRPTNDDGQPIKGRRYEAGAHFGDSYIDLDVTPAAKPTIGADALRALGYTVDPAQGHITKPSKPLKIYRGLMPYMLDVSHSQPTD